MAPETPPYPNDPLRWVAADVRFPPVDRLATELPPEFREHFHERFPVVEPFGQIAISLGFPGSPSALPQQLTLHRILQRDRLMAITLGRDGLTLETTDYPGWATFGPVLAEVVRQVETTSRPDGVVRVGLRYIDEIRLPTAPETTTGWTNWIDPRLLGPLALLDDEEPSTANITLQYGEPPGYVTVFRASPLSSGWTVNPDGPLRQPIGLPAGPYFLLDTDASWADPSRQVPPFDSDVISSVFEDLHTRCHDLFEASITPDLQQLLRRDPTEVWGAV